MSKDNSDFFKTKNSWSEIKDKLLGGYLTPYFQKILQTNKPTFYVDCFAGKGDRRKSKSASIASIFTMCTKAMMSHATLNSQKTERTSTSLSCFHMG